MISKRLFGTYDEPVHCRLELDLSEEDFPGYTVAGHVCRRRITATLHGAVLEIALESGCRPLCAFACARCLAERDAAVPMS